MAPRLKLFAAGGLLLFAAAPAWAQLSAEEQAYRQAIAARAAKIVDQLAIEDQQQAARVGQLIADQYRALRDLHDTRDQALDKLHAEPAADGQDTAKRQIETDSTLKVEQVHRSFLARLAAELPSDDVDRVKDGMTYGVVPNTYGVYLELLPDLLDEEKREIMANLVEAREYAMDAGSSDEKHAWFGKYKGRINNYLSSRGYNLKQAEQDLAARRKAEQERKDAQATSAP